jgi:hypothetical protein
MKRMALAAVIMAWGLCGRAVHADTISCSFSSTTGATIQFDGSTDTITFPDGGYDFQIIDSTPGSLVNLYGTISGTFTVGTISGNPLTSETATVTPSVGSTLNIYDGTNWLTADLDWKDITVVNKLFGYMNGLGAVNLSNVSYSGTNTGLQSMANGTDQTAVLTFLFVARFRRKAA